MKQYPGERDICLNFIRIHLNMCNATVAIETVSSPWQQDVLGRGSSSNVLW